eukprot:jgi/Bigna1/89647/estExt_fgenesh1_pg.C_530028
METVQQPGRQEDVPPPGEQRPLGIPLGEQEGRLAAWSLLEAPRSHAFPYSGSIFLEGQRENEPLLRRETRKGLPLTFFTMVLAIAALLLVVATAGGVHSGHLLHSAPLTSHPPTSYISPKRASNLWRLRGGRQSVMGIDIGNQNTRVSIISGAGVDTCLTEASKRLSPTIVAFEGSTFESRAVASPMLSEASKNAIFGMKRFIGRKFEDEIVQKEANLVNTKLEKDERGEPAAVVRYGQETRKVSMVSVMAMLREGMGRERFKYFNKLKKMQSIATMNVGENNAEMVTEAVVTVPDYFTERQRRAMIDAAEIAGIKLLQLISEHAATSLAYGILRAGDLPKEKPVTVGFIDIGHSATSVYFVDFTQTEMRVRGIATDPNLGGRDLDNILVERFGAEFKKKFCCDYKMSAKATGKLKNACEKAKKTLSSGTTMAQVKIDFSWTDFENICAPFVGRLQDLISRALQRSGLEGKQDTVSSIEAVGGGTRPKPILEAVEKFFGKQMSRSLVQDECTSNGAALQAARLTPRIRVREFGVNDLPHRPVSFIKTQGRAIPVLIVFSPNSKDKSLPVGKMLTYNNTASALQSLSIMILSLRSDGAQSFENEEEAQIGCWSIAAPLANTTKGAEEKVKLKLKFTSDGVVDLELAELHKTINLLVPAPTAAPTTVPPTAAPINASKTAEAAANGERMAIDEDPAESVPSSPSPAPAPIPVAADGSTSKKAAANETTAPPTQAPVKMEWVKRIYSSNLKVVRTQGYGMNAREMKAFKDIENAFATKDKEIMERIRSGNLKNFVAPDEKDVLLEELKEADNWLSYNGTTASVQEIKEYLVVLKNSSAHVVARYEADGTRRAAFEDLMEAIEDAKAAAAEKDPNKAHISQEERDSVLKAADQTDTWATAESEKQDETPGYETPILTAEILGEKQKELRELVKQVMERPKPTPAPTPAPTPKPTENKEQSKKEEGEKKKKLGEDEEMKDEGKKGEEPPTPPIPAEIPSEAIPQAKEPVGEGQATQPMEIEDESKPVTK